MPMQQ